MSKSNAIVLLLACFLLSTMIGVVHAGCTPNPDTGVCITTDKTTYSPGENVIATVTIAPRLGYPGLSVEILPVPESPGCGVYCFIAIGFVSLSGVGVTVPLKLPENTTAGHYDVEVFFQWTPLAAVGIIVTGQTPVPESPAVLALLIPALLVGIYALQRRKNLSVPERL